MIHVKIWGISLLEFNTGDKNTAELNNWNSGTGLDQIIKAQVLSK